MTGTTRGDEGSAAPASSVLRSPAEIWEPRTMQSYAASYKRWRFFSDLSWELPRAESDRLDHLIAKAMDSQKEDWLRLQWAPVAKCFSTLISIETGGQSARLDCFVLLIENRRRRLKCD